MDSTEYPSIWRVTVLLLIFRLANVRAQAPAITTSTFDCEGSVYIRDGECDLFNNNAACAYDGGDCCECTCVDNIYNNCGPEFECQDPDAWCSAATTNPTPTPTVSPTSSCSGIPNYIGDGDCDTSNNNEACDYDGGDCCECTCEDGDVFTCGPFDDECNDPEANCASLSPTTSPTVAETSTIIPADETTSSSASGISTAVIASVSVAGALLIGIIGLFLMRRHTKGRGGGTAAGDGTSATGGAVPGPASASEDRFVASTATARPMLFPVALEVEGVTNAGAGTCYPSAPPFEEVETGKDGGVGVGAISSVGPTTNVPEDVPLPPSYDEVINDTVQ